MRKAILSFDVDGLWAQEQLWGKLSTSQIEEIKKNDVVIKKGLPIVLNFLKEHDIKATFFVVGQNVENYKNEHKRILKEGHEIASHTYSHPVNLSSLTYKEKEFEISKNEKIIQQILNVKPIGFRAPTYSIDKETINILEKRNYLYDSSIIPTFIPGFTKIKNLFLSSKPFFLTKEKKLLEIPLSKFIIFPVLGTALYNLGKTYFSLISFFIRNKPLVLNFHIRDFVKIRRGAFWLPSYKKRMKLFNHVIKKLIKNYEFLTLEDFANTY